jgi:hypothetical protein
LIFGFPFTANPEKPHIQHIIGLKSMGDPKTRLRSPRTA